MSTPKEKLFRRIEYLAGLLATLLIAGGLLAAAYAEPERMEQAQVELIQHNLDVAMTLYAENCAVCHGLDGNGIGASPALNSDALSKSDPQSLGKIISRGLYETNMPAWSKDDGGPLNDYQIDQLVSLITQGNWQFVQDRVVNLGLAPLIPFTTEPDPQLLASLQAMQGGEQLARGVTLYAENCVACHGADGLGTNLAPALNDPVVRNRDLEELQRVMLYGNPGTLMAGWDKTLDESDISALLTLITDWDSVPSGTIPAPDIPVPITVESIALGSEIYSATCSRCHGSDGQGTPRAPALNVKGFLSDTTDLAMQQIITLGVPDTSMPAWGDRLTDAELQALVGYIRQWEPNAPEVAEPARGNGGPWWQTEGTSAGKNGGGPPWARNSGSTPIPDPAPQPDTGQTISAEQLISTTRHNPTKVLQASTNNGHPWVVPTSESAGFWTGLEPRAIGLTAGVVGTALLLVSLSLFGLHRLHRR